MGEVIEMPMRGEMYCPNCRKAAGDMLNIGPSHYEVCHSCRCYWLIGSNLFDTWKREDDSVWKANAEILGKYRQVEPYIRQPHGGTDSILSDSGIPL